MARQRQYMVEALEPREVMSTMSGVTIPPLLSSHAGAVANLTTALSAQVESTFGQGLMQQSALRLDVPPGPC